MIWVKFLFQIVVNAWFVAIAVAAAEFIVTGNHVGNETFLNWFGIAFVVAGISKIIDMVEIYKILKSKDLM